MKKIIIGYGISLALAVCYLVFFEFSLNVFLPALVFVSLAWFDIIDYISENKAIGLMWLLFSFGLFGLIASYFSFPSSYGDSTMYVIGVSVASIICGTLHSFTDKIFDFIDKEKTDTFDSRFPVTLITIVFVVCIGISDLIRTDIAYKESIKQQIKEEKFVPVKFQSKEIYDGNTFYFYEVKGKTFFIKPNEFPEIRKAYKTFKAKVILGNYYEGYGAYNVERIEFEKKGNH